MNNVAESKITDEFRAAVERMSTSNSGDRPNLVDVLALAEIMMGSIQGFFSSIDTEVYSEFREIASHISSMKSDIAALQPNDLKLEKMPRAGKELDAIVKSTEEATNTIMTSAESIMAADTSDPAAYQTAVNDEVMKIFEACSFQDITGQRISKVIETLQFIESRIDRLVDTMGVSDGDAALSDEEQERQDRKDDQLLNGPQLDGEGTSQDDIDALFD